MGDYATTDTVQALIPEFTMTTTSKPTLAEADTMLDQVEGEVNGVLAAQGYSSIPATGDNDVKMLGGYVSKKAASDVWLAAFMDDDPPYHIKEWRTEWRDFIARLRRGEQDLIDQNPQGDQDVYFAIVRTPTRDTLFTNRSGTTDWDE